MCKVQQTPLVGLFEISHVLNMPVKGEKKNIAYFIAVQYFQKYAYSLSCRDLGEKVNSTVNMYGARAPKDWKQGNQLAWFCPVMKDLPTNTSKAH